ncbi:MAG: site-2 protease family protein [Acidobacteria bacterium]|nr:site-2 protease family protein [Acidobacteriota bacterium]MBV9484308.1 site-2 protease family protein [Acidobacteriota bacterium]
MRAQIKLGRIAGIEIGLHYSWFLIAILIVFSLKDQFRTVNPDWSLGLMWAIALVTAVLFFVALLLHELAHSLVAQSRGLRVRAITLFALGGVSQIESEANDAKSEFWIAIVGPLTSLMIGFICLGLERLASPRGSSEPGAPLLALLLWLGRINIVLAVFNMIPGYPLDGGRVLRSLIWWLGHSQERATKWASYTGQAVAFLFILYGLFGFFTGRNYQGGLWLAFIGWFLLDASRSTSLQMEIMTGLRGRRVGDIMERDCALVEGHISLQDFVDEYVLRSGRRCFMVVQNNSLVGLITPNEVKKVPREEWLQTSVQSAMIPLRQLHVVSPETSAIEALDLLTHQDVNQVPVVSQGHPVGIFSRGQVIRYLQAHSELGKH